MEFAEPAPLSSPTPESTLDPIGLVLGDALRELIWTGAMSSERSRQVEVGMSEIGSLCDRQLAYRAAGVPPVNVGNDPMPSIIGTGFHLHMEKVFRSLDPRRWLVETPLTYQGIKGTCDLYDRRRKLLIDWKSTSKQKLRRLRQDGPPHQAQVQIQLYGAAMREAGEDPQRLALAYVPRDGQLDDLWVWSTTPDQSIVDTAMERFHLIVALTSDLSPAQAPATPTRLCSFCSHFSSGSTDLARACPGLTSS